MTKVNRMKRVSLFLLGFLIVSLFLSLYQIPEVKAGSGSFGYETKGSSSYTSMYNYIFGSEFSCPETGTATTMTAYMKCPASGYGFQMGIYKSSDKSLVGDTLEYRSTGAVDTWVTINIESGGSLTAQNYYLVIWQDDNGMEFYYDAGANAAYDEETYTGVNPAFPNPWDQTDWGDKKFSIFCNYTTAGAQEYTEEFTETIDVSASLYLWKALFQKYIETTTISATAYSWKEKASFYTETTTITEQLNKWIELRRFFTETITITETANFAMEILLEITEFTETITVDASLFLWKAKQFIIEETVRPVANFYDWIELKMTMIEFSELIQLDAIMILTFEIIALPVEPSTFGTLSLVIGIIALAIAVTAFAAKTRD